ncbi:hypothetical protein [Paenibacillus senegalensis]|uniref:hypothetical protein n=1 Tax=Paenibacillus senegalensis TaxID=1465766 RepID=UPI0002897518|nr:hypothetical protein [Paenibacillus senegalensis]
MTIILILGTVLVPLAMMLAEMRYAVLRVVYDLLALLSAIGFGIVASVAVYEVIRSGTVFMTTVHQVFLNPVFLLTGAYFGVYIVYLLLRQSWMELRLVLSKI